MRGKIESVVLRSLENFEEENLAIIHARDLAYGDS